MRRGSEGNVPADEGKPNVVIEMAVSGFVPNCHQEISGEFHDTLFHDVLLNWISMIMITRFTRKQILPIECSDNSAVTQRTPFVGMYMSR